ncbi:MAG: TraB/GumN family protein [Chthoniobacterales bacterium]
MVWKFLLRQSSGLVLPLILCAQARSETPSGCVWKVTAPDGGTLYLGGSIHSLRSVDYPLPPAYNRAFEASSRVALEVEDKALRNSGPALEKSGEYPKGDSLKNHVDPRTYDYVRRVFALLHVPEAKIARCRPWFLVIMLESAGRHGSSEDLGVDAFITRRAKANDKAVIGLETLAEHLRVFSGLTDRQSEALLLLTFIPQASAQKGGDRLMEAWRRGDVDTLAAIVHGEYREFPAFGNRLLDERNRNWLPKLEREIHSGKTCFVVVGAGHLGGPAGLLSLLRGHGYRLEKL